MSLRAAIHDCLLADAAVAALIGADDAMRHYPVRAPQNPSLPFVVSTQVNGGALQSHGTPDDAEDSLDETVIQFSCFGETMASALALRAAVRAALINDENGVLATAHVTVTAPDERELPVDEVDIYGALLDLTFFHNPST